MCLERCVWSGATHSDGLERSDVFEAGFGSEDNPVVKDMHQATATVRFGAVGKSGAKSGKRRLAKHLWAASWPSDLTDRANRGRTALSAVRMECRDRLPWMRVGLCGE